MEVFKVLEYSSKEILYFAKTLLKQNLELLSRLHLQVLFSSQNSTSE